MRRKQLKRKQKEDLQTNFKHLVLKETVRLFSISSTFNLAQQPATHGKEKGGKVKEKVVLPLLELSALPRVSLRLSLRVFLRVSPHVCPRVSQAEHDCRRGALPSSQKSPVALNNPDSRNSGLWATKMKPYLHNPTISTN